MIQIPMDILHQFPIRKTKSQKQLFRDAICRYAGQLGYSSRIENGSFGARNVVIGDPEKAGYLVTAHYDTCAAMPFPNFLTPCSLFGFVLCQMVQFLMIAVTAIILSYMQSIIIAGIGVILGRNMGDAWIVFVGLVAPFLICVNVILVVCWLLIGPPNKSNVNDNTSGVVTLLEIMRTMPENQRHKVCFVLFDLEESGLIGSSFYRKAHKKATDHQLVLNLDCVGDGDHILMFPTKALKKNRKKLTSLYKACGYFGNKSLLVHEKGFGIYPSDQMVFPYGVGICALQKGKCGLYVNRIHTARDKVLEITNVNILRAALTSFICCDAVNQKGSK